MRRPPLVAALLALTLAGCAGGTGQTPSAAPSPEPSVAPATASPETVILGVTIHWDGTSCDFLGPRVIRDGTTARFEYTFDEGTDPPLGIVNGVRPGTTWDMVLEGTGTSPISENIPDWAILTGVAQITPGTSALYTIRSDIAGQPVGGYYVGCHTAPADSGGTDKAYAAALLLIAGP